MKKELGEKIILIHDITVTDPISGDKTIIPKNTICLNYGIPSPSYKYNKNFIELKLIEPLEKNNVVIERIVLKRNSKSIKSLVD